MPRPRKCRHVAALPAATFFKPQGIPLRDLQVVALTIDGLEALRHADHEGLGHEAAAAEMGISQPTFSRLLGEARRAVAAALVGGHALQIEGGNFRLAEDEDRGRGQGRGHGRRHRGGGEHASCRGRGSRHGHSDPAALDEAEPRPYLDSDTKGIPADASDDG